MSIARHVAIVGSATLASRVLGFIRDVAIAGLFGAGARADAFVVAFQFSNLVRRLWTEGALNAAFVPLYLRRRDTGGEAAAAAYAGQLIGTLTVTLLILCGALALAMPLLMLMLAPGFTGDAPRLTLAIEMARLMLPYLVLAGPVAVLMGVLNANHRFATAAMAAVTFNVAILAVIAIVVLAQWGDSDRSAIAVAVAVALAGVCQLALVGLAVLRGPHRASPLGLLPPGDTRRFVALAVPGLIASGIPQLTMIAGVMVASDWPGAVSWLYFANRLVELPLGIVGIAIGTVMTPALSHAVRGADAQNAPRTIAHGLEMALGLALPAAIALMVLAAPIVRILFERGAFSPADSAATALMLALLAAGLPGQVLIKALAPVFFAREDTRTPMLAALAGLAAAVLGALAFAFAGQPFGIACAIAASGWVGAALLWLAAARRGLIRIPLAVWRRILLIALSAVVMGTAVHLAAEYTGLVSGGGGRLAQIARLAAVIALGLLVYAACLGLSGILRPKDLRTALRPGGSV